MITWDLKEMLAEGWTKVRAEELIKTAEQDMKIYSDKKYIRWAHSRGFLAETAYVNNLTNENCCNYISDYDFYKAWPLNDWSRIWVNDKLTLKLMLEGTQFGSFLPEYYYYSSPHGLRTLSDCAFKEATIEHLLETLRQKTVFACKPCNGSLSIGFVKMSCVGGVYRINEQIVSDKDIALFVETHINYLYTEYIVPSNLFSKYGESIHTMRIVTLNKDGYNPRIIGGYFRFPNKSNGASNYNIMDGLDNRKYNIYAGFDADDGSYGNAVATYMDRAIPIKCHPDTGCEINGQIENYDNLKRLVLGVAKKFCTLEYLGFDVGITDEGFKCMEINTLPGITYMQIFKPMRKDDFVNSYFNEKLKKIESLSSEQKAYRNNIVR